MRSRVAGNRGVARHCCSPSSGPAVTSKARLPWRNALFCPRIKISRKGLTGNYLVAYTQVSEYVRVSLRRSRRVARGASNARHKTSCGRFGPTGQRLNQAVATAEGVSDWWTRDGVKGEAKVLRELPFRFRVVQNQLRSWKSLASIPKGT